MGECEFAKFTWVVGALVRPIAQFRAKAVPRNICVPKLVQQVAYGIVVHDAAFTLAGE